MLAGGVVVGGVTVLSLQAAAAIVLVVGVLALWSRSRVAGVTALWLLWVLTPGLRRVFALVGAYPPADPLSLAPVLATGGIAVLEFARADLSLRARRVVALAMLGFCFGLPAAVANPQAGLFGLAAYGSGVAAFVIGYAERADRGGGFTLRRVLLVAGPLLALYGILQYFLPLTAWDSLWLETVDVRSFEAPEEDHVRVFSTLNAPQPFATVLAIALIFIFASRRLSPQPLLIAAIVAFALALTYVRSALVALVFALVVLVLVTRGRAMPRVAAIVATCVVTVLALSPVSSTADAVLERATSLGELESDISADARSETAGELFPIAFSTPLGHGLGSAGEATKLSGVDRLRFPDNGYLAAVWQVGPVGFLLIVGAILWGIAAAARARVSGPARSELRALILATLALLLAYAAGSDVFYGVSGAIFWYLLGKGMWLADDAQARRRVGGQRAGTAITSRA